MCLAPDGGGSGGMPSGPRPNTILGDGGTAPAAPSLPQHSVPTPAPQPALGELDIDTPIAPSPPSRDFASTGARAGARALDGPPPGGDPLMPPASFIDEDGAESAPPFATVTGPAPKPLPVPKAKSFIPQTTLPAAPITPGGPLPAPGPIGAARRAWPRRASGSAPSLRRTRSLGPGPESAKPPAPTIPAPTVPKPILDFDADGKSAHIRPTFPGAHVTHPIDSAKQMAAFIKGVEGADPATIRRHGLDPARVGILRDMLRVARGGGSQDGRDFGPVMELRQRIEALPDTGRNDADYFRFLLDGVQRHASHPAKVEESLSHAYRLFQNHTPQPEPDLGRVGDFVLEVTPAGDVRDAMQGIGRAYTAFGKGNTAEGVAALASTFGATARGVTGPLGKLAARAAEAGLDTPLGKRLTKQLQAELPRHAFQLALRHAAKWDKLPADLRDTVRDVVATNAGPAAKAGQDMVMQALDKGHSLQEALGMGMYSALSGALLNAAGKSGPVKRLIADARGQIEQSKLDALVLDIIGKKFTGEMQRTMDEFVTDKFARERQRTD